MPALSNAKHESFAYNLAKGMGKSDAYVHAGYSDSPAAATRLSKTLEVAARIQELRDEMMGAVNELISAPTEENAQSLVDMGLTLDWCALQYKTIASEARTAGQFSAATAAVKNIQSLIEIDGKRTDKDEGHDSELISIGGLKEISSILKDLPDGVDFIDVTPAPEEETPVMVNLELLEAQNDDDN